jgi:hypothetical protein
MFYEGRRDHSKYFSLKIKLRTCIKEVSYVTVETNHLIVVNIMFLYIMHLPLSI